MPKPKTPITGLVRTRPATRERIGKFYRYERNERTTPFPPEHLAAILKSIDPEELVAYPNLEPLYHRLAEYLGVDRSQVLLFSGSDTAIKSVFEIFVGEDDQVVTLSPTYGMYAVYTKMYGADLVELHYDDDFRMPVERICDAIGSNTALVAIANPNHTGTSLPAEDLMRVLARAQEFDAAVLIDEAYFHFCEVTMIGSIEEFNNLIVVRTFSKALGIAGVRVGYAVAQKELIDMLFKVKLTHEINVFAAKTGHYLLDHPEILRDNLKDVKEAKDLLYRRLPAMNFEVLRSETNFVYFKVPPETDGQALVQELEKRGILIGGPVNAAPFYGHLRVTVGTESQMNMFCDLLEQLVQPVS